MTDAKKVGSLQNAVGRENTANCDCQLPAIPEILPGNFLLIISKDHR